MSSLRPFFSFYGAKWRAAPHYPRPEHDLIIEPFAGSAGYALRYPHQRVILCDDDERVAATWAYLLRVTPEEVRRLPLLGADDDVRDLPLPQEAKWLIGWWLNKGMTSPCHTPSKWMRNPLPGRLATYWGAGIRERIAQQVPAIRHWRIIHGSYHGFSAEPATWFVDPPYNNAAGARYRKSRIDYAHLSRWCRSLPGQVIVCEQAGADWLPFAHMMTAKTTDGPKRDGVSREVIWIKGAS